MKLADFKFSRVAGFMGFFVALTAAVTVRHALTPVYRAEGTIRATYAGVPVNPTSAYAQVALPRTSVFPPVDEATLSADSFVKGVVGRMSRVERATLLDGAPSVSAQDDAQVASALRKTRLLKEDKLNQSLIITCSHADRVLAARLVNLHLAEWSAYFERAGDDDLRAERQKAEERLLLAKGMIERLRAELLGFRNAHSQWKSSQFAGNAYYVETRRIMWREERLVADVIPKHLAYIEERRPVRGFAEVEPAKISGADDYSKSTRPDYLFIGGGALSAGLLCGLAWGRRSSRRASCSHLVQSRILTSSGYKFVRLVVLISAVVALTATLTFICLREPMYQADITIRVGDPHPERYLETPRIFNFDVKTFTSDLFLHGVANRLTNSERVTLLRSQSNELVDDDRRVVAALRKARSLRVKNGSLTLICYHADKDLPERLITLYMQEWDEYLQRLGAERIQPRIKELEQWLAAETRRLKELREYHNGAGMQVELERLERVTTVTLPEQISALAKASPYDEVGYILGARNPLLDYPSKATVFGDFFIGAGAMCVGAGTLVFGILVGVAVWQLMTRKNSNQRGVVLDGGGV